MSGVHVPIDRRHLLRGLGGAASLFGLGGARGLRPARPAADASLQRLTDHQPTGDRSGHTRPVRAARTFSMVAAKAPPGVDVAVRVSSDGDHFGPWLPLHPNDVEGEGPDGAEARAATNAWMRLTTPAWTGPARWLQLRVEGGDARQVEIFTVDAGARTEDAAVAGWSSTASVQLAAATPLTPAQRDTADTALPVGGGLRIVTREEWGADETLRRNDPSYADRVLHGVVHHTAGNNTYDPADGPAIVRGIYEFHVRANGWSDIGYNLLVDKYGVVYEGRFGGLDRAVIGAHARGANTGSFGVAVLGDFRWQELGWDARTTLFEVLAWKFGLHAIEPFGTVTTASGQPDVPVLAGHRDVGSTECPGDRVHLHLDEWRQGLADQATPTLTDIAGHPHEDAIRRLRAAGITTGYADGTFRPNEPVTRDQMATFLTRAAKLEPGGRAPFTDVATTHPHHDGIAAAAAAGVAAGRTDGTFRPGDVVSRAQMATFLARARGLEDRAGSTFVDVDPDDIHHGAIEAVAHAQITLGYGDGRFGPADEVRRGQMASFLVRAFELPELGEGPQDPVDLDEPDDADEVEDPDDHQPPGDADDPDGTSVARTV